MHDNYESTDLENSMGDREQNARQPEPIGVLADLFGGRRLEVEELDRIGLRE